jgi:hypothetical protein
MCVGGRQPIKAPKIDESIKEVPPDVEKVEEAVYVEEPKPGTSQFLHPNAGLDIIVEETSDLSDIENSRVHKMSQMPQPVRKKKRGNILQRIFHGKQEPTECVLVDAKIVPSLTAPEECRSVCTTDIVDREMDVEVVNVETMSDSSDSDSDEAPEDAVIESQDIPSVDNNNNDPLLDGENALVKNASSDSNQTFIYIDDADEYCDTDYLHEKEADEIAGCEVDDENVLLNNIGGDQQQIQDVYVEDGDAEQSPSETEENLTIDDHSGAPPHGDAGETMKGPETEVGEIVSGKSVLLKYLQENSANIEADAVIMAKVEQNVNVDENVKIAAAENEHVSQVPPRSDSENDEIRTEFGKIEMEIEQLQEDLRLLGKRRWRVSISTYYICI